MSLMTTYKRISKENRVSKVLNLTYKKSKCSKLDRDSVCVVLLTNSVFFFRFQVLVVTDLSFLRSIVAELESMS